MSVEMIYSDYLDNLDDKIAAYLIFLGDLTICYLLEENLDDKQKEELTDMANYYENLWYALVNLPVNNIQ